jgi:hypothetical protein
MVDAEKGGSARIAGRGDLQFAMTNRVATPILEFIEKFSTMV